MRDLRPRENADAPYLIPRTRHDNKRIKREFARAQVRKVVGIGRPCHSQIHQLLTEKQLEREFNTIAKLLSGRGDFCELDRRETTWI